MSDVKDQIAAIWTMITPKGAFDFVYKMGEDPVTPEERPIWMGDFSKKWENPTDPVAFTFTLTDEKYIQNAFDFLYNKVA